METYPKHIFLTGATGFLGKAVLEKIVRSFPEYVIVYVLVRRKGKVSGKERLEKELFVSEIFDRVKKEKNLQDNIKFIEYMNKRVKAIEGDVSMVGLGINEAILKDVLRANVELAIHCAASVDFDERLDLAIGNNINGALETLTVCASCPKVKRIVHVSTAYVSVPQTHRKKIAEQIPELDFDYVALVKNALSLKSDLPELEKFTQKVLADNRYPNTYTITKAIAEVMINNKFGNNPNCSIHIVRPSIVGASWKEPVPGWVDAVSAASAVFLAGAMGLVTLIPGDPRSVADIIPVDIVANHILIAGVEPQESVIRVSHSCSSVENPVRWRVLHDSVQRSFLHIGLPKARLNIGSRPSMKMISDPTMFKMEWAFCYDVPTVMLQAIAQISRNPQQVKLSKMMTLLNDRAGKVIDLFTPFTKNEYFFAADSSLAIWIEDMHKGNNKFYQELNIDIRDVAWSVYFYNYVYGLMRFVLHEDLIPVTEINVSHNDLKLNSERLITWDADHHLISFPGLLPDITWAYTQSRAPGYTQSGGLLGRALGITGWREGLNHEAKHVPRKTIRSVPDMMTRVLDSESVAKAVKAEARKNASKSSGKQTKRTSGDGKEVNHLKQGRIAARGRAETVYKKLASTLEDQPPRAFGWFLRKIWRQLFDGIQVDELGMDRLRSLLVANNELGAKSRPVVLLPSHRSYVDFLVLSYVMFAYNIPVPHIAASEDFLNMGPVSNLLRASGAFFIRRDGSSATEDAIYREIFKEYIFRLLEDGQIIEFFLEGTRSRSGKSLQPKTGMMRMLLEAISLGRVEDVLLIPISINYERPLEVSLYAEELLGSSKPRESLWNLLKGTTALGKRFGTIHLQFADPVSLKGLSVAPSTIPPAVQLIKAVDSASATFTTHLVATLLLMYRNGATFEQLLRGLAFLREEVYKRGGRVIGVEGMRPEETLTRALQLLDGLVAKRDVPALYQVDWSPRNWTNFLALSYYRNNIVHLFCDEAIWAAVIHSRSKTAVVVTPTPNGSLVVDAKGKPRFVPPKNEKTKIGEGRVQIIATQEELADDVHFLHGLLSREFVSSTFKDARALADLERRCVVQVDCQSKSIIVRESKSFALLCSIVWPLIDGYFVAATSLFALLNKNAIPLPELSSRMLALAETLYTDGVVMHYESCSSGTLSNSLETFHEWGVIKYEKVPLPKLPMQGQKYRTDVSLCAEFDSRDALRSLVGKIDNLRKRGHRDFSVDEAGTPFGVAHFPVLARM